MSVRKLINRVDFFSLELSNICNLNCDFCANRLMIREKGAMDLELAKRLIKEVKDTKFCYQIVTNLMGEPLLYKHLFELLKYATKLNQDIFLITNGEGLDEEMTIKLFENSPSRICISYHSNDESSYGHKHSVLTYEQYRKRIFEFIELKFKLDVKISIDVHMISTFNLPHDKFKILDNYEAIGLFKNDWIAFAQFVKKKYRISWKVPDSIYPGANMLLPDFCISIYFFYHLWSNTILPSGTTIIPSVKCPCPSPFNQFNVLWNGDLTLCCFDYDGDLVYDNIKDKSIIDAFNSDKISSIRERFIDSKGLSKKCSYCYGKIVNLDGSEYNPAKRFYKLTTLDKLKKCYFRTYRFLWKVATSRFNYKKLIPYLEMRSWYLRRQYAKYYKRLGNCNNVVEKKEEQ